VELPISCSQGQRSRSSDVKTQEIATYLAYMFTYGRVPVAQAAPVAQAPTANSA